MKRRMVDTDTFLLNAREVHGDKYDYSRVKYVNKSSRVTIVCPVHGEFEQIPYLHLRFGCKKCKRIFDTDGFVIRAREVHGDKYDYSKVRYINKLSKVKIICPVHGEFETYPKSHITGTGCVRCYNSLDNDAFIIKARDVHGDKYDYSKVQYVHSKNKVIIICPVHGEFGQTPRSHLNGHGCFKCSSCGSTDNFINRSNIIHNYKYNYSKVNYINNTEKVTIICPVHGEFKQAPHNHLSGKGCYTCMIDSYRRSVGDFINLSNDVHNNKYDYSKVDYKNWKSPVIIICPEHGEFVQSPTGHLRGNGCPSCPIIISSGHQEIIDFIKSFYNKKLCVNDRSAINPFELDILLPDDNIAIEYNGLYYHSFNNIESKEEKFKHYYKYDLCSSNNIKLIQIFENEWIDNITKEIIKSKLAVMLGRGRKLYARNCNTVNVDNHNYKVFMDDNHLQGSCNASVRIGLLLNNKLVCAMSFKKHHKYEWEIMRFATIKYHVVIGGFTKLLKYFINNFNPSQILTYVDRRYSDGGIYKKSGFVLDGITPPNYFYIKSSSLFSRQKFQKKKLKFKLDDFNNNLSEAVNMFNNGYRRIWDAGNFRFLYR